MPSPNITDPEISIVVPLYNEDESIGELFLQIQQELEKNTTFEVIFVDDGSTDKSWEIIQSMRENHGSLVKGIRFRRNYGKSQALQKGFERAEGAYIVTMDADLQDNPTEILPMVDMLKDGLDLVSGWKQKRHDPISKTLPSLFFNFVTRKATGIKLNDFNCGLKAYRKEVIRDIKLYGELHRYIPYVAYQQGYANIGEKVVEHRARKYGTSKFGFSRFIKGFLDLMTLLFLFHYMRRPMHFFGTAGTLFLGAGTLITAYLVVMRIFYEQYLSDRPLLLFGILLMVLGVQFFSIGFLGELVNKNRIDNNEADINIKDIIS